MIPPMAATLMSFPVLRSDALAVDSSSVSEMRPSAAPPPARTARAPIRHARGAVSGATNRTTLSTESPMARAEMTARPPAMPWCTDERGMSEGPKESRAAPVTKGASGPLVSGFMRWASLRSKVRKVGSVAMV